ncbi:glycerophosphodiester phosphodiesterase family protein [Microbacterium sp. MPKO10]|uniref:glycerophosphodiester phosphodiesterase family protein n=1 Tax=Microbacterium sp. MPKO10 TaxID=2989818 RepID=UPI002236AFEA|nr:glycerophosphodiester phosphodiesterase family protein [Microbacterium sp. MPKO10]MCW4457628.1 glycerophosphodiester phosphodiesterase family protein [Microbacterium sp. MPKO10]
MSALVIGHRGAPGYRPEHSASGYRLAFELGVDAVEPDVVATRDGVLVVRHENEIGGTTDVAQHPEFADRRRRMIIDGVEVAGWFTEDFTWDELQTLRVRERIPELRPGSAAYDGTERMLRFTDLLDLLREHEKVSGRRVGLVVEVKHATHFASIGLPLDVLLARELGTTDWSSGTGLVIESFEPDLLGRLRERGVDARYVFLVEKSGAPADRVARDGSAARAYADDLTEAGLEALAATVDGISVDKSYLLPWTRLGSSVGDLVARAHRRELGVFTWTLRPENAFLDARHREPGERRAFGAWQREFDEILSTRIDGVFADHPDLALERRAVSGTA